MVNITLKFKMFKTFSFCFFISVFLQMVSSLDPCSHHKKCNDCIRDPKMCVWCAAEDNLTAYRCVSNDSVSEDWCSDHIINPMSIRVVEEEMEFRSDLGNIVQIKPQTIRMKLRPGQRIDFQFSFLPAKDYPADLYFLFDASVSMKSLRQETAHQINVFYTEMQKLTKEVKLGFGTFVDKNAFPFTDNTNSVLTYSFNHQLKLSDDFAKFEDLLSTIQFGKNYDVPEGGLDALAQVIVCKNLIGWRDESRKIVIFLTNAPYHAAGDAKWAGIYEPYDGRCYTENQTYTKELEMDYPSVGILNKLASEEDVLVFFLVAGEFNNYENLARTIKGARAVFFKSVRNYKISDILKEIYEEISLILKLKVNMQSKLKNKIKLSFKPNCYDNDADKSCKINPKTETTFAGNIELLEDIDEDNVKIDIGFEGVKEKLTLALEVIKECECKKENDSLCNGGGKRRCGICECFPDRHGENCKCTSTSDMTDTVSCKASNKTSIECSGRGSCVCGSCVCDDGYKGVYCDCSTNNCPSYNNLMCGGHGSCECGVCRCHEGWSGAACSCSLSEKPCKTGLNTCFNYGICECGGCKCDKLCPFDARSSQDAHCRPNSCPNCHGRQCYLLENYALSSKESIACEGDVCQCRDRVNVTVVKNLTTGDIENWKLCANVRVGFGCYTKFVYKYDDERYLIHIIVQSEHDCADNYYAIGGACLATFILVGIASLFTWKAIITYRDRQEYNRFIKEVTEAEGNPNPIYKGACVTFDNPIFRKRSIKL